MMSKSVTFLFWSQAFPQCCSSPESAAWTRSSPRRQSVSFSASTPCLWWHCSPWRCPAGCTSCSLNPGMFSASAGTTCLTLVRCQLPLESENGKKWYSVSMSLPSVPTAKGHIDQRMAAEAEKVARGEKVEGRYLTYFLSQTSLPMKTVYSNVTELLLAGVDTVGLSSSPGWSFVQQISSPVTHSPFRSPALCPGPCTSCPGTRQCRPRCGRRSWVCWGVEGYRWQATWPGCLCWRPQSKKYSGRNQKVSLLAWKKHVFSFFF